MLPANGANPQSLESPSFSRTPTVYVIGDAGGGKYTLFGYPSQDKGNVPARCALRLTGSAGAIASDPSGRVYVALAESSGGGFVDVRAPGCGALVATVNDTYNEPGMIAVHGNSIYIGGATRRTGPNIAVCGMDGCRRKLTNSSLGAGSDLKSIATDSEGNVWAAFYDEHGSVRLAVWRDGKMPARLVGGYDILNPGYIMFDSYDTLVSIADLAQNFYRFACSVAMARCHRTGHIRFSHGITNGGSVNAQDTDVQVIDYTTQATDVYSYPALTYRYTYKKGSRGPAHPVAITQVGGAN